ncbi:MAG: hypothetical protein ACTHOI_07245 [Sphingomicrobium sp.]
MRLIAAAILLVAASAAHAAPLTVRTGESWLFNVENGEPVNARKVEGTAKAAKGQLMVTVRALLGTSMIVTNNSSTAYTYRAELFVGGRPSGARTCTLPTGAEPTLEQWPQKADAVRLSAFRPAGPGGRC